jgi:hypothetical protein
MDCEPKKKKKVRLMEVVHLAKFGTTKSALWSELDDQSLIKY